MSLTLDDRVAIEALLYLYNVAADERDAEAYAALYTEDGVWDGPLGRFEGQDGLRRLISVIASTPALDGTRHWANNIRIAGDSAAGTATVSLDNVLAQATPGGPRFASMSGSDASLVRRDGRWLFRQRAVTTYRPVSPAATA